MKRLFPVGLTLALLCFAAPAIAATDGGGLSKVDQLRRSVEAVPENLDLRYYLGVALLENGFYPEALDAFRRAYPAYADSKEMNYNLALACYQVGDLDSSILYLEVAEELGALKEPETYRVEDLYFNIGLKYQERSSFREAERAFLRVLQLDGGRVQVHRALGDLYNRREEPDRALAEFERYYASSPEDREIQQFLYASYLNRGLALLNRGEASQAGILFDRATAMTEENSLAAYFKGYLEYKEGNYSLAAQTILAVYPSLTEESRDKAAPILYNCALELSQNDATLQESLEILRPLLDGESPLERDIFLAGNILMRLGQYEQALALFEKILSLDPAHQGALLNLLPAREKAVDQLTARAEDYLHAERILEAQRAVEAALRIDPADEKASAIKVKVLHSRDRLATEHLDESGHLLAQGALRQALQQVRQALEMNPELEKGALLHEEILAALGQEIAAGLSQGETYLAAQDVGNAQEAFEAVLALDPGNAEALNGMTRLTTIAQRQAGRKVEQGRIALDQGDLAAAAAAFEEALNLAPDMQEAREGLAKTDALIEKMLTQRVLTAKDALRRGDYHDALRQLQLARNLRDTPLVRQELEATQKALASRVAELLAGADRTFAQNDLKRSASLCRKILEIDPGNGDGESKLRTLNRAIASAVSGFLRQAREAMAVEKYGRALDAYKKALDLDSANGEVLRGLRDWKEKTGQYLVNLEKTAAEALARGDYPQAEKLFTDVLALSPARAEALAGVKKLSELQGAGLKPGDEGRLYLEGIDLYTQGRYEEAVTAWKKVQILDPGHVKARMNIEKALRKLQSIKEKRNG